MFEDFTPAARSALTAARAEARDHGHAEVVTAHLVVALLEQGDPEVDQLLGGVLTAASIRERIEESMTAAHADGETAVVQRPPFAASLKRILRELDQRGGSANDRVVRPLHLVVAVLESANPLVDGALRAVGADEVALAAAGRAAVAGSAPAAGNDPSTATLSLPARSATPSVAASTTPALVQRKRSTEPESVPEPEPEPEPESEPQAAPEPEPEAAAPLAATLTPRMAAPRPEPRLVPKPAHGAEPERPDLPPPRAVQRDTTRPAARTPPAGESLAQLGGTLARSFAIAAGLGAVVYVRTARRARKRAERASRSKRVVIR